MRFVICYSIFITVYITVFSNIVIEYVETIIVHEFCLEKYRHEVLGFQYYVCHEVRTFYICRDTVVELFLKFYFWLWLMRANWG